MQGKSFVDLQSQVNIASDVKLVAAILRMDVELHVLDRERLLYCSCLDV